MKLKLILTFLLFQLSWNAKATTEVCGFVAEDTVWTLTDSPVHVVYDLNVARLNPGARCSVVGTGDFATVVNGYVQSLGIEDTPVVFRAATDNPAGWGELSFEGSAGPSKFLWTEIEQANNGAVRVVRS
jgi:hypothetical protein